MSEESRATLKVAFDNNNKPSYYYLGKIPSITIDKIEKKVLIEIATDRPLINSKPTKADSAIFSLLPFQSISIVYNINSELDQSMLKKDGYDFGYLLTPHSKGVNAVILFKSRANTNIFDVELVLQAGEGILITSKFVVIGDCS